MIIIRNGGGGTWTPVSTERFCTPRRDCAEAWRTERETALGRASEPIHGPVRTARHRLDESGQPEGGGRSTASELG